MLRANEYPRYHLNFPGNIPGHSLLPVTGEIRRGLLGCDQPLGPGLQGDFRCRFPGPYTRPVPLCASAAGVLLPVTAVFLLVQYTQSPAVCQPGIGERAAWHSHFTFPSLSQVRERLTSRSVPPGPVNTASP